MYDYVRPGTSMYGLYPSKFVQKLNIIQLKQAMFLYSRLVHVKLLGKGQSVSYGRLYITSGD
jgi:alanine racemase